MPSQSWTMIWFFFPLLSSLSSSLSSLFIGSVLPGGGEVGDVTDIDPGDVREPGDVLVPLGFGGGVGASTFRCPAWTRRDNPLGSPFAAAVG